MFSGVNLLIGTENGLMLLDRSGQGKVYQLISRRRFQQMEVLEGQNILVTVSGKKNRVRVYYLSWLKSKILRTDGLSDVSTYKLHRTVRQRKRRDTIFWTKLYLHQLCRRQFRYRLILCNTHNSRNHQ